MISSSSEPQHTTQRCSYNDGLGKNNVVTNNLWVHRVSDMFNNLIIILFNVLNAKYCITKTLQKILKLEAFSEVTHGVLGPMQKRP